MAITRGARGPSGGGSSLSDSTPQPLGVAAAGVSTSASRADHVHTLPTIPALSSATPQPIGTATAGVSADAARADHVHAAGTLTTYDFSSSTGVTLENGSVGGTAAVTGGELVLTCPSTPAARHFGVNQEAPRAVISVPSHLGRTPVRWRVRARLVSLSTGTNAYLQITTAAGANRFGIYVTATGGYGAEDNVNLISYGTGTGFSTSGTGWAEVEYDGEWGYFRIGTGVGTAPPTSWTEVARGNIGTPRPIQARLVGSTNTAPGSVVTIKWDDLIFEVLP